MPLSLPSSAASLHEAAAQDNPIKSNNRPRAPLEALLPATRQRILLEQCLDLSSQLLRTSSTPASTSTAATISQLQAILLSPTSSQDKPDHHFDSHLSGMAIRTACNFYTAQLKFADSYLLTANKNDKSTMIRRDGGVPTVKQVVIADLDLRDLYRNELQTLVDDAQAELYLQAMDAVELNTLLTRAKRASDHWFGLISEQDVKEARDAVLANLN